MVEYVLIAILTIGAHAPSVTAGYAGTLDACMAAGRDWESQVKLQYPNTVWRAEWQCRPQGVPA